MRGVVGVDAAAKGRVARADQDNVAVEYSLGVDDAVCDYVGGKGEGFDREKSVGGGGGQKLGVGSRGKEQAVVVTV